jgi:hypothetical protein
MVTADVRRPNVFSAGSCSETEVIGGSSKMSDFGTATSENRSFAARKAKTARAGYKISYFVTSSLNNSIKKGCGGPSGG